MRKLVIDRAAIKNNLTVIKDRAAGAAIYGVVTGDGQGVGAAALAQLLRLIILFGDRGNRRRD